MTHSEPSFAVAAHPRLGVYVTGADKGRLHFWRFNSDNDCALDAYSVNSSDAGCIHKLKFNSYGDKIATNDAKGNLYIFGVGQTNKLSETSFNQQAFGETLDFDFVNQGSVICATGLLPSTHLMVYDTLMPIRKCLVVKEKIGGEMLLYLHGRNQILVMNSEEDVMLYDMRMHKFYEKAMLISRNPKLQKMSITAATLSTEEDLMITGDSEGIIKIWDIESEFSLRESLLGFEESSVGVKQVVLTHNNMLYALGSNGNLLTNNRLHKTHSGIYLIS